MLKILRAEHILAIILTSIFLLCDAVVLCFFISNFDSTPEMSSSDAAEYHIVQTPALSIKTLIGTPQGPATDANANSVKQLNDVISAQLKTLTQTKVPPKF